MDISSQSTTNQQAIGSEMAWSRLCDYIQANTDEVIRFCRAYAYSLGLVVKGQDADEVAVEIMSELALRAKQSAANYDTTRPAQPWLRKIALRVAQDRMGKEQKRRENEISLELQADSLFDLASSPEMLAESSEAVQTILAPLKPEDRRIVRLVAIEEWDMEAVGKQLGMKSATVRQRYYRALKHLKTVAVQDEREGMK